MKKSQKIFSTIIIVVIKSIGTLILLALLAFFGTSFSPIYNFHQPKPFSGPDIFNPYEKFDSLSQIVRVAERFKDIDKINDTLTCTVVLGDEFSVQMNSRSFKTNIDPLFLNTLLTCRHHHIMLIYNAQRFQHVDKLLRGVTTYCVECKKIWRVCIQKTYDAWTIENCADPTVIKPIARHGWFIRDKDFKAYDTLACVDNLIHSVKSGDMIPEEEILSNRGDVNIDLTEGDFRRSLTHKRFGNLKR